MRQAQPQAIWRLIIGMAQIALATATIIAWVAGGPTTLIVIGALFTLAAMVASVALWRGR